MHIAEMLKLATKSERLRWARINAGYPTAAQAARRLGVPYGTYSGHENGLRGVKESELERYAKAFGVSVTWLLFGGEEEDLDNQMVNYFGIFGLEPNGKLQGVTPDNLSTLLIFPKLSDTPAMFLEVAGNYARGIARSGWRIVADRSFAPADERFLGCLCVCKLKRDEYYLKFIEEGSKKGAFNLESPMDETMKNVKVLEASPVIAVLTGKAVGEIEKLNKEQFKLAWKGVDRDITRF